MTAREDEGASGIGVGLRRASGLHWVGVGIGVVVTVSLAVVQIWLMLGESAGDVVYTVNPVRTQVVSAGQATGLEILHNGRKIGDVNVTAVQVAVWNAGYGSVRSEEILKPVVVCTEPWVEILEVSIAKCWRESEVTGFRVVDLAEEMKVGKVPIEWRILERGDGASIQLVYVGSEEVGFRVDGVIEGRGEMREVVIDIGVKSAEEQVRSKRVFGKIVAIGGICIVFPGIAVIMWLAWGMRPWSRFIRYIVVGSWVTGIVMLVLGGITLARWVIPGPPFGF